MPKKQCNSSGEEFSAGVLSTLRSVGVDATKVDDFNFYLYLDSEEQAKECVQPLRDSGFTVEVQPSASGTQWLCLASMKFAPKPERLTEIGAQFLALAAQHDGQFDGWEIQPKMMNIDEGLLKRLMEQLGAQEGEK